MFIESRQIIRNRLKLFFHFIDKRCPVIGSLLRGLRSGKLFNRARYNVFGENNTIQFSGSVLSSVVFDILGNDNKILIEQDCELDGVTFFFRGNGHSVLIGKSCKFYDGTVLWFEDANCQLIVGENSTFGSVHIAVTEPGSKVIIGRDCMLAYEIDIRSGDSHPIFCAQSGDRINHAEDVIIGDHVWIAAHSVLLKGTTIPDDSVVATGSIVTGKFLTKGVIIAGNPSKVVREGVTWSRERVDAKEPVTLI